MDAIHEEEDMDSADPFEDGFEDGVAEITRLMHLHDRQALIDRQPVPTTRPVQVGELSIDEAARLAMINADLDMNGNNTLVGLSTTMIVMDEAVSFRDNTVVALPGETVGDTMLRIDNVLSQDQRANYADAWTTQFRGATSEPTTNLADRVREAKRRFQRQPNGSASRLYVGRAEILAMRADSEDVEDMINSGSCWFEGLVVFWVNAQEHLHVC